MATLTKKDLLEAIEDMPMDAEIIIELEDGYAEAVEIECYKNNKIYIVCE